MFCTNCGTQFEGKFCPECGKPSEGVICNAGGGSIERHNINANDSGSVAVDLLPATYDMFVEIEHLCNQMNEAEAKKLALMDETFSKNINLGKEAALLYVTCGLAGFALKKKKKEWEKQKAQDLLDLQAETDLVMQKAYDILCSDLYAKAKSTYAEKYFDIDTCKILLDYFNTGRVDTWKEALNLYEMEAYQRKMVDVAQQSLEVQQHLLDLTEIGVQLQAQQVEQLINQSEILKEQNAKMKYIIKNTKKTYRAARVDAFCSVVMMLFK